MCFYFVGHWNQWPWHFSDKKEKKSWKKKVILFFNVCLLIFAATTLTCEDREWFLFLVLFYIYKYIQNVVQFIFNEGILNFGLLRHLFPIVCQTREFFLIIDIRLFVFFGVYIFRALLFLIITVYCMSWYTVCDLCDVLLYLFILFQLCRIYNEKKNTRKSTHSTNLCVFISVFEGKCFQNFNF